MRAWTILLAGLVLTGLIAGCNGKDEGSPPDTTTTPGTGTTTSPGTQTTSPPTNTTPNPPNQVFSDSMGFDAQGNDGAKTFTVSVGAQRLDITAYLNTTGPGPYFVQNEGTPPGATKAYVAISMGNTTGRIEWDAKNGAASMAGESIYGVKTLTFHAVPGGPVLAGSWQVTMGGTGTNAQADITIVEMFTHG